MEYSMLLKIGSLEFLQAEPSWVMSHYTMLYEYGKQTSESAAF